MAFEDLLNQGFFDPYAPKPKDVPKYTDDEIAKRKKEKELAEKKLQEQMKKDPFNMQTYAPASTAPGERIEEIEEPKPQEQYEPPVDVAKEDAAKEEERRAKLRAGRTGTLLTSPLGLTGGSPLLSKKTLLGS